MTTYLRVALRLVILAVLLTPPNQVLAQEDGRWVRQALRSSCQWWENCPRYRYKWKYVRHYQIRNVYRERDYDRDRQCQDFVMTVGPERYGRERAKEAAEQFWMEEVRARHGVRFMDLRNSRGGTWECGRSSTGNRASESTADSIGKYLEQCTLRARPCRAELERVNKE